MACTKFPETGKKIQVKVTTSETKGTVTTTTGLEKSGKFIIDAYIEDDYYDSSDGETKSAGKYIDNADVVMNAGEWGFATDQYWVAGTTTRFWAWHPVTVKGTREIADLTDTPAAEKLPFKYTTPEPDGSTDADKAEDILFAYAEEAYDGSNQAISLTFRHALSQIRFCVSTNDGTFDTGLRIKSIKISGLHNHGEAEFSDNGSGVWEWDKEAYDGTVTYGQTYNADFSELPVSGWTASSYSRNGNNYDLHICENVFFMIPQTVTNANLVEIVFAFEDDQEETKSVSIASSAGQEWLSDHYYNYKIVATTLGREIDAAVILLGWSYRDDKIFVF